MLYCCQSCQRNGDTSHLIHDRYANFDSNPSRMLLTTSCTTCTPYRGRLVHQRGRCLRDANGFSSMLHQGTCQSHVQEQCQANILGLRLIFARVTADGKYSSDKVTSNPDIPQDGELFRCSKSSDNPHSKDCLAHKSSSLTQPILGLRYAPSHVGA
jgi:predicted metal-binding protein